MWIRWSHMCWIRIVCVFQAIKCKILLFCLTHPKLSISLPIIKYVSKRYRAAISFMYATFALRSFYN